MKFLARLFCFSDPHTAPSAHTVDLSSSTTRGSTSTKVPENSPLPAPATFPASSSVPAVPPSATPTAKTSPPPATPATQPTRSSTKTKTSTNANLDALEPYTASRTAALFDSYADEDEPDVIGPEGLERLCGDAGVPMDGVGPLVFAWLVGAKEMGKIARAEWEKGMGAMQCAYSFSTHATWCAHRTWVYLQDLVGARAQARTG